VGLRCGMMVRFRHCSPLWAMGFDTGIVAAVDKSAANHFREMRERMPDLLGAVAGRLLDRIEAEGDRTGVVVRIDPCPRIPLGLEVMTLENWLEEVEGSSSPNLN
jgi:hypothetical protein